LRAFLRRDRIAAEAEARGHDPGGLARCVDGKGVVIFTLASGGGIRDSGKAIFSTLREPLISDRHSCLPP
jgi:hypothetical protein